MVYRYFCTKREAQTFLKIVQNRKFCSLIDPLIFFIFESFFFLCRIWVFIFLLLSFLFLCFAQLVSRDPAINVCGAANFVCFKTLFIIVHISLHIFRWVDHKLTYHFLHFYIKNYNFIIFNISLLLIDKRNNITNFFFIRNLDKIQFYVYFLCFANCIVLRNLCSYFKFIL